MRLFTLQLNLAVAGLCQEAIPEPVETLPLHSACARTCVDVHCPGTDRLAEQPLTLLWAERLKRLRQPCWATQRYSVTGLSRLSCINLPQKTSAEIAKWLAA
jgi:hypothetical protein